MLNRSAEGRLFITLAGAELALGVLAVFLGWFTDVNPREHIPSIHRWDILLKQSGWGILASIPLIAMVMSMALLPRNFGRDLLDSTHRLLVDHFRELSYEELIVLALCAGTCEELLFRGWLQCILSGGTDMTQWSAWRLVLGILVSALIFGALHFISVPYFAFAAMFGIYAGILYYASESLWIPIVLHAFYDAVVMLWLVKWRGKPKGSIGAVADNARKD